MRIPRNGHFPGTTYLLVLGMLLGGCTSTEPLPTPAPLLSGAATAPPITPTIEPCAFVEATQDLPAVTAQFDQALKQLQPGASGRAEAYGENCVSAAGPATFSAMETDFYITAQVNDLNDQTELGGWIVNAMNIIESLPPGLLSGPQEGFAEFTFKTESDQKVLRVSIGNYKNLPGTIAPPDIIPALFPTP
ncbi:MAG TPA: hypothetical protein VLZ89_15365 [Anaerolineales bacterium]|nr:hypothetical protein [Anaerolineales bacterium]